MSCDVGKATEGLENELWRRWSDGKFGEWAELIDIVIAEHILQHFLHFTYVTAHSPILSSLYLRHSSFSNLSVASPTPQFILQPFPRFSYVTSSSLNSPGEPPMENLENIRENAEIVIKESKDISLERNSGKNKIIITCSQQNVMQKSKYNKSN